MTLLHVINFNNVVKNVFTFEKAMHRTRCITHIAHLKNSFLLFNSMSGDKYFKASRISCFHKFIIHRYRCANYRKNIRGCLPLHSELLPSLLGFLYVSIYKQLQTTKHKFRIRKDTRKACPFYRPGLRRAHDFPPK